MELIFGKYGKFGRKINVNQCPRWSRGRVARPYPREPTVRQLTLFFCRKKDNFTRKIWAKDSPQSELRISRYKGNGEGAEIENAETER